MQLIFPIAGIAVIGVATFAFLVFTRTEPVDPTKSTTEVEIKENVVAATTGGIIHTTHEARDWREYVGKNPLLVFIERKYPTTQPAAGMDFWGVKSSDAEKWDYSGTSRFDVGGLTWENWNSAFTTQSAQLRYTNQSP